MSFARQRLLGLTIVDFSANIGWNDNGSSVTIKLAPEDNEQISSFTIGSPINFTFGSFKFNGFLERVIENKDTGGKNYEVTLSDGKEILRNVEVITTNFYGWKEPSYDCLTTNLLNPYRFYESQAYGNSLSDDSGMLLSKFCEGVNITSNNCGLIHRGIKYNINISNLASLLPAFYRVAGPTINLLDAISTICEDAGYNYYIDRVGYTFYVRLASLNSGGGNQGVSTVISQKAQERNVVSYKSGLENASNVVSNYVLYGGNYEEAIVTTAGTDPDFPPYDLISSFWGYNPVDNTPIKGYNDTFNVLTGIGGSILYPVEWLDLPTLGVEDIIGNTLYRTNTLELQLVVGGKETWELWLEMYKGAAYQTIFGRPPRPLPYLSLMLTGGAAESNITREFVAGENDIGVIRSSRVYDWLKGMADGFFGKQFLVRMAMPVGVRDKVEGYVDQYDPNKIHYNYVPNESGHFQNNDGNVAGLYLTEYGDAVARNEEGKILNWAFFNTLYPSYSFIGSSEEILPLGTITGVKTTLSDKWVWKGNKPHFHITINQPAFEIQDRNLTPRCAPVGGLTEEVGYPKVIQVLFGTAYNTNAGSSLKLRVGPLPLYPVFTLTNIKSENTFYGPWISKYGNGGKTKFEQDASVTPWTYGSREKMQEVSSQRIKDELAYMENVETGQYTKLGLPEYSLGDELVSSGPRLTNISVSYGTSGVSTTYTVSTYTPKFGFLPKQSIDNVKRLAQKTYATRRFMLQQYFDMQRSVQSLIRTFIGRGIYKFSITATLGKRHDRSTPHAMLLLQSYNPKELYDQGANKTKTIGGFTTIGEAIKDISPAQGDSSRFNRSVVASIDQIFRPYANATETEKIPKITLPTSDLVQQGGDNNPNPYIPTSISYNPLKINSDIDLVMPDIGDISQWDHHNFPGQYAIDNTILAGKGVAFKGPMMLTGWGTAITGENAYDLVPNVQNGFPWQDGKDFKTGPIDLMWDEVRGVWTSHDILLCESTEDIIGTDSIPEGSLLKFAFAEANIYLGRKADPSSETIVVTNIGKKDIPANTPFIAKYDVYNNQWIAEYGGGEQYRFWEECASTDISQGGNGEEYYWDFDVEENIDDPGYGDIAEGYCTDVLNKVTVIKTNGYSGSYEVVKGLIECPDGSTQPVIDELWFHHGLFKEIVPIETDPCEDHQPTTLPPPTTTSPPATTTPSPPPTCLYFDSVANCYLCRRCDTPPDGDNWQPADGGQQFSADACAARATELGTTCITTTLAPGCYLTPVTGSDASSCYQCIPASSYNPDDPTYEDQGQFMGCDECVTAADELNTSPECALSVCLYQRQDNPFCYYCGDCGAAGSIGNFTGVDRNEACAQEANRLSASACNVTTTTPGPDICLYVNEDTGCYICQDCRYGPDNSTNLGTYANADLCNASIPENSTICTTTTVAPGCYQIVDSETGCRICVPEDDAGGQGAYFPNCELCQVSADSINNDPESSCNTQTYCLYQDQSTNGICYYCSQCDGVFDPDNPSLGSYGSLQACETEASSREPASCNTTTTTAPTTTTVTPTTTQNPNCVQVVSSVSCGPNGLSVSYIDVARCGVSQVYQTDFQTVILRAEVSSLKRQLSDIYNALEKHGIKIDNA